MMTWDWKHQVYIYKYLKRVYDGTCKRLMIFVPPRHGKSELVTVRYAAYVIKTDPSKNVIIGSYNQRLANRFSRKIKRVLSDDSVLNAETQRHVKGDTTGSAGIPARPCLGGTTKPAEREVTGEPPVGDINDRDLRAGSPRSNSKAPRLSDSAVKTPDESSFPFIKPRQANSEAEWETREGGGLRAVGVGSGVTGFGANLIIVDDPVKSRSEAESERMRENVWDWFNDDLYTRLEPDGSIILIQTRWHEDDLAGRLLRESKEEGGEQWEVVNLPALAETGSAGIPARRCFGEQAEEEQMDVATEPPTEDINDNHWRAGSPRSNFAGNAGALACIDAKASGERGEETMLSETEITPPNEFAETYAAYAGGTGVAGEGACVPGNGDPLGRAPGEALCPDRFDENALGRLKRKLGSYSFAALYQQRPVPAEGGLFKRAWFNIVSHAPPNLRWKRGTDPGISGKSDADYTASFRIAYDREGSMYIDGGYRRQMEYPELRKFILGRILAEPDTEHGIELSAHGNAILQDLRREKSVRGRAFRGIRVKDSKVARALSWLALAEEGKVFLIRAAWNQEFLDEAASFPTGTHDDQIDAVSLAVKMATQQKNRGYGFVIW